LGIKRTGGKTKAKKPTLGAIVHSCKIVGQKEHGRLCGRIGLTLKAGKTYASQTKSEHPAVRRRGGSGKLSDQCEKGRPQKKPTEKS